MRLILIGFCVVLLAGCATKRYPIATPLSPAQMARMTCEDLELEASETEQVRQQIRETAEVDWRSVAGFLGDYGIGNAMARDDAERALNARQASITEAQNRQGCFD